MFEERIYPDEMTGIDFVFFFDSWQLIGKELSFVIIGRIIIHRQHGVESAMVIKDWKVVK